MNTSFSSETEEIVACAVCFLGVDDQGAKICDFCHNVCHRECIQAWLRRNGQCPCCTSTSFTSARSFALPINSRLHSSESVTETITDERLNSLNSNNGSMSLDQPWSLQMRRHIVQASHRRWIVALLPRSDYTLAVSKDGNCTAINQRSTFSWSTDVVMMGGPLTYIWHAAIDEKRQRLLLNFHNVLDVLCRIPVGIFYVDLSELEKSSDDRASKVKPKLLFSEKHWCCFGLRVDPFADLIFCADWRRGKIGVWSLEDMENNRKAEPKHIITKPYELTSFYPTRCALHRPNPINTPDIRTLAISDWRSDSVYMFHVTVGSEISSKYEATLATRGTSLGKVWGPVDIQFDVSGTLLIGDQQNRRVQVFVAAPELPLFEVRTSEQLKAMFSALAIVDLGNFRSSNSQQSLSNSSLVQSKHIMIGLNNGEIHYLKVGQ